MSLDGMRVCGGVQTFSWHLYIWLLHFKEEKPLSPHTNQHDTSWEWESNHSSLMTC